MDKHKEPVLPNRGNAALFLSCDLVLLTVHWQVYELLKTIHKTQVMANKNSFRTPYSTLLPKHTEI